MSSEATQMLCRVIRSFEEPKTLGAADGEGGEGDWERAALTSASHAKRCKVYPILSKQNFFRFVTPLPFFSIRENKLVWPGKEMSTSFKNLSANFCPV